MTLRLALFPLVLFLAACNGEGTDDTEVDTDTEADTAIDENSITGIVNSDPRFTMLAEAAARVGFDTILASEGSFTVFAPTDDAFQEFLDIVGVPSVSDLPTQSLSGILAYHGLSMAVASDSLPPRAESLAGYTIFFPEGDTLMVNNVAIIDADVQASNGVIHVVDDLLFVPTLGAAAQFAGHSAFSEALGEASSATVARLHNLNPAADPITVFAPSNAAMAALDTTGWVEADYDALFDYHTVDGDLQVSDFPLATPTYATNDFGQSLSLVFQTEDDDLVNGVAIDVPDIVALTGSLHLVDEVLHPLTTAEIVENGGFTKLIEAFETAESPVPLTDDQAFTLFAPTDSAFALARVHLEAMTPAELTTVLSTHIVPGPAPLLSTDLATQPYTSQAGVTVDVVAGTDITVDGATVVTPDIVGTNGVVHAIDAVIGFEAR